MIAAQRRLNAGSVHADMGRVRMDSAHADARHPARADRFGLDSALLLAYVTCFVIEAALLPVDHPVGNWAEIGVALGLQVGVGLLLVFGSRLSVRNAWAFELLGIVAYLASVALLRDGASPTAGYGPLVLLPVVWASLRGRRLSLGLALAGVAVVYVVPTLVIGPPQYPEGGWRAGLLFVIVASVIGLAVRGLVARVDELLERLADLARTDSLTGIPNRRAWHELLRRESALARRSDVPLSVALIDLDRFKQYNDLHGHLAGDRLLLSATAAWRSTLRDTDVLARWGGDEFVLLLPNCNAEQTEALLARMQASCPSAPFSAGVAESDGHESPEALLAVADEALYRAKRGRAEARSALRAGV
jgi:diguanylate cyclase (GGDEF)-like protein